MTAATTAAALLSLLRHGDSAFPAGAIAFSWGLESAYGEGVVETPDQLAAFIGQQLRLRWASGDRVVLLQAWRAEDLAALCAVDEAADWLALPAALRLGGRQAGRALLTTHARLDTPGAAAYRALVLADQAPGQLAAVQGLVWRGCGIGAEAAVLLQAWQLIQGMLAAAIRLGRIGALRAQALLDDLLAAAAALAEQPPPAEPWSSAVLADIALLRHPVAGTRLFAN